MTEYLGWIATSMSVGSYFCTRAEALRGVQMMAALVWMGYGALIQASPVVAANMLIFCAAAWSLTRPSGSRPTAESRDGSSVQDAARGAGPIPLATRSAVTVRRSWRA